MGNNSNSARNKNLNNCYAYSKLMAILEEEINVLAGGICGNNMKVLPGKYHHLTLLRECEGGGFNCLYDY